MIRTEGLTKRYGSLLAVDDLSFRVEPGEVLGFLGPNGAGKSTTMRMIAGFITPTAGRAEVCGHDVGREPLAARTVLGYLPEGAPAYPEMTPRGFLQFVARLRAMAPGQLRSRMDEVVQRLHLGPVLDRSIDTLSKGYRRRVGLAQAILHDPKVLILDEPTDGLDPNQKHEVRTLIRDIASEKVIVVSTHILEEVEALCSRAIIIAGGRLLADDTPRALTSRSRYHNAVTLRVDGDVPPAAVRDALAALPEVADVETGGDRLTALPRDARPLLPSIGELVRERGWQLAELTLESGRLDEVFRRITQEGSRT